VEGEPGSTGMVATGCVHEDDGGLLVERTHRGLEERAFAKREQP
jgi:hypothetical protein